MKAVTFVGNQTMHVEHFFIDCTMLLGNWEYMYLFCLINYCSKFDFKQSNETILLGIKREDGKTESKSDLRISNSIILVSKMCICKMRYGEIKYIF